MTTFKFPEGFKFRNGRDVRPLTPTGPAYDVLRAQQIAEHEASGGSSFSDQLREVLAWGPSGATAISLWNAGYETDPTFNLNQKRLDDVTKGIDQDLWSVYADAVSEDHLNYLHTRNQLLMEKRDVLSRGVGFSSFSANILGSLADPGSVAVGILTGGGSTVARMGFAGRAAFGAVVAGGSNAALAGIQSSVDPSITGQDILKAGLSGVGFGAAGGLTGSMARLPRAAAGAVGQSAGPLMVDLWGNPDRGQTIVDLGTNMAFGGLFNAIHGPAARPEQVRMAEAMDRVGRRMVGEGTGQPVDYASSTPGLIDIVDPESLKHPFPMDGFPADAVSGKPYSQDAGILGPRDLAQSGRVISSKVFGNERDARVYAQAVPGATIQNVLGTWTVLQTEGGASLSRNSNLRLTPADIAVDLGLRGVIEDLSARGMTAGEIWGMIDGLDVAPRYDDETGRQFIDSARRDLRVPSRNKPEEVASWAQRKGLDTTPLDGEGAASFRSGLDTRIQQEIAARNPNKSLVTDNVVGEKASVGGQTTNPVATGVNTDTPIVAMGAAAAGETDNILKPPTHWEDLDLTDLAKRLHSAEGIAKASFSWKVNLFGKDLGLARWDMPGMVGGSDIPEYRFLARAAGQDWVPDKSGAPITYSGSEWAIDRHKAIVGEAFLAHDREYIAHRTAGGKMTEAEFAHAVTEATRMGIPEGTDPNVAAVAKAHADIYNRLHEQAGRHGVELGKAENFTPRRHNAEARDAIVAELGAKLAPGQDPAIQWQAGYEAVTKFWQDAIEAKIEPTRGTVTIAGKSSPGWIREGSDQARSRAEAIMKNGGRKSTEDPTSTRIDLNELHRADIPLPDGSTYPLAITDMLENDSRVLMAAYSHAMHGKMAVSTIAKILGTNMDGSSELINGINGIVNHLRELARERGIPEAQFKPDLDKIETMLKLTGGVPVYGQTGFNRMLRVVRQVGHLRTMSNVGTGINNMGELASAGGEIGASYVASRVSPNLVNVINMARTGQQGPQMARDLHAVGIGIDRVVSRILPRVGEDLAHPIGKNKVEMAASRAERFAYDASAQSFGTDIARGIVAEAFKNRWADIAFSGNGFSEKRLALMGLSGTERYTAPDGFSKPVVDAILDQIKEHAVWIDKPGGTLDHMNFEAWDPYLRRRFVQAMSRTARREVLENNPASYSRWMNSAVGKVVADLRTFSFASHTAKFLVEAKTRDAVSAYKVVLGSISAAATYTAITMMNAPFQKDPKKYLEERLAADKVMKAAFSRSAYSAMFPTFIDSAVSDFRLMEMAGLSDNHDPVFSFARTSGLEGGILLGNPTFDMLDKIGFTQGDLFRVPRAALAPALPGYRFSQQDYRALKAGLAIPDVLNLRKLMDRYAEDLPPTSK